MSRRHTGAPTAGPAARPVVVVLALLLLAFAVLCVLELLARAHAIGTTPLAPGFADFVDRVHMTGWLPWAAGAVAVLGLLLVIAALRPRRRTHLPAGDGTLWLRPTDVARLCSSAALTRPGVATAHTNVTRRKAVVAATVGGRDRDELRSEITAAVENAVSTLDSPPRVRVRLTSGGSK